MSYAHLPWFAYIANYLATKRSFSLVQGRERKVLLTRKALVLDDLYLFKHGVDQVVYSFIPKSEIYSILTFYTRMLVVITLEVIGQMQKSYKAGFIVSLYFMMLTFSVLLVSFLSV